MDMPEANTEVYKPRKPSESDYFKCVESHFEELEMLWDERYEKQYGFWRPYVKDVILKYLDCGDLHCGFARIKCKDCGHEYLLGYSCKRRNFCPSCHQKRVIEFGEHLCENVLKQVPHRQWVFSLPKRLRIYFMFDRTLLKKLCLCAWNVLSSYLIQSIPHDDTTPAAIVSIHTFGDFQNFHPHLHILAPDGCFREDGSFTLSPTPSPSDLEEPFRQEVFKMLKKEGKINDFIIENMMSWHHSGFNVYCGAPIWPHDEEGMEKLARYVVRAAFSKERMTYIPAQISDDGVAKVIYKSKDGKETKTFNALDWLAQLTTHIPDKNEQTVRYYGFYSNKMRGQRKKRNEDSVIPNVIESELSSKSFRKNWARLIQKIYKTDPLICPKCNGSMRILSFIEQDEVIEKILKHLDLWNTHSHDPPPKKSENLNLNELVYDYSDSQMPDYNLWD